MEIIPYGPIKNITSGTGFSSLIPYNDSGVGTNNQGSGTEKFYNYKPVARWTSDLLVLYIERIMWWDYHSWFHPDGIKEVDFILNDGITQTVTQPEYNPATKLNEWCVRLNKDDIVDAMGENFNNVELRAIVRPNVGVPRVLQHDVAGISGAEATDLV